MIAFVIAVLMLFAVEGFAAVTATGVDSGQMTHTSNKRIRWFTVAFDSSYPAGGETLSARSMGFSAIDAVHIMPQNGYTFEYDTTNSKIKVFSNAPPIVYEEKHTATALATGYSGIILDYPAAWIINIADAVGNQKLVATGLTTANLGTDEACLYAAIADDTRTRITVKTTGDFYVTYATQAWTDLYNQLVQSEAVTLTGGTSNALTYTPMGFAYVSMRTNDDNLTMVPAAYTVSDGYIGINPGAHATALKANSSQNTYTTYVTYLKMPASGWLYDRFVDSEDPTDAASGSYSKSTFDYPLLMPLATGTFLGYTGTAAYGGSVPMGTSYTSVAGGYAQIAWHAADTAATGSAPAAGHVVAWDGDTATYGIGYGVDHSYLKGTIDEIPNLKPLEVKNGTDLSGLTGVRFMVIGR